MATKIGDLMTRDPVMLEADRPVSEAAKVMRKEDVGDVLVIRSGVLEGILTDRDVVVRCLAVGADPRTTAVERICSTQLVTLSPHDHPDEAARVMGEKAIRRIPVVEAGRPVGLVSRGDLARAGERCPAQDVGSTERPGR